MSSKYRRQSIYLQRKSFSRANSTMDPFDDLDGTSSSTSPCTLGGSASALCHQAAPPPPSLESMKVIKGFEFVTFTPVEVQPTSAFPPGALSFDAQPKNSSNSLVRTYSTSRVTSGSSDTMVKSFDLDRMPENITTSEISDDDARNALLAYVSNKFCYGTKAAQQAVVRDMIQSFVFQYSLESFVEKRQLCWTYEPYADACITFPENCSLSVPENAWNIEVNEIEHLEWYISQHEALHRPSSPQPGPSSGLRAIPETSNTHSPASSPEGSPKPTAKRSSVSRKISTVSQVSKRKESTALRPNSVDLFQNKTVNVIVPGTVSVHSCHNCGGVGRKRCTTCAGSGSKSCQSCTGNGYYGGGYYHKSVLTKTFESQGDYCWRCHGRGRLRCFACNGDGMITCAACLGSGQIKCYIKLIVTLTNHQDTVLIRDHNSVEVPVEALNLADGDVVFEEEGHNLYHITNYIDESITRESERLISAHARDYLRTSRLILQRHRVSVIPIAKVSAAWNRKPFHYYVFGSTSRRCFTANYPQRYSCSCCCIL